MHLESGVCPSGVDRQKINRYCREVDPNHVFTTKQIGWHDTNAATDIATSAAWDGSWYRCYLCQSGFDTLRGLNQHLGSPAHQQKTYYCPRCRKEYVSLSGLVNHLESESCGPFRFGGNPVGLGFVNQLRINAWGGVKVRFGLQSTPRSVSPLFGLLISCTHALLLMLNAFKYSSTFWRIEGYGRAILFWKHFAVRPYISTRTIGAQNVAIHLEMSWMGKELSMRGLAADLATLLIYLYVDRLPSRWEPTEWPTLLLSNFPRSIYLQIIVAGDLLTHLEDEFGMNSGSILWKPIWVDCVGYQVATIGSRIGTYPRSACSTTPMSIPCRSETFFEPIRLTIYFFFQCHYYVLVLLAFNGPHGRMTRWDLLLL